MDYTYVSNKVVEVRVDFSRPESSIQYRFHDRFEGEDWEDSEFQSAIVNHLPAEKVLEMVSAWLGVDKEEG